MWNLLAASTMKPEELEFVVDSRAETVKNSKSLRTVVIANGEVRSHVLACKQGPHRMSASHINQSQSLVLGGWLRNVHHLVVIQLHAVQVACGSDWILRRTYSAGLAQILLQQSRHTARTLKTSTLRFQAKSKTPLVTGAGFWNKLLTSSSNILSHQTSM